MPITAERATPQDLEMMQIMTDPVNFAKYMFGWEARDYQMLMMRDKSLNRVMRCGRRVGKTEAMCAFMLWYAFTHGYDPEGDQSDPLNRAHRCIIAAPYETQIKLIFTKLREFIRKSPIIQQAIKSDTKHPEYIEFKNGSFIQGFTAGTKSGNEGASTRGQAADWIFLDEMDFMKDKDIEAIIAITADDTGRIGIWACSTPTGKRGKFYDWCRNAARADRLKPGIYRGPEWTQFFFPSTCSPNWKGKKDERHWKVMLSEQGFIHEILAEFGEETCGVFSKEKIEQSLCDYRYYWDEEKKELTYPGYDAIRTIGVDWDKYANDTQIVVLEYARSNNKFKVMARIAIPRGERTLDNAVDMIVRLNHAFRPSFIYVDRGMGENQVELMHKYGEQAGLNTDHPAYGMQFKVKGIQFHQNIEVPDPVTHTYDKKPAKHLMVNNLQAMFERDQMLLCKHDTMMWTQLEDYQVVKVSQTGVPQYTSVNEHSVDALMLAALAMSMEFPEVVKFLDKIRAARSFALVKNFDPIARMQEKEAEEQGEPTFGMIKVEDIKTTTNLDSRKLARGVPWKTESKLPQWGSRGRGSSHGSYHGRTRI